MFRHNFTAKIYGLFILLCLVTFTQAQKKTNESPTAKNGIPSPKQVLGFHPTDDKTIADWSQITNYFQKLDAASDKITVKQIGQTTLGKPFITAFISSADNIKNLDKYQRINQKLADPRQIKDEAEMEKLVKTGKTIIAISCSIHSTEIVASQMSMNLAFELATATDDETREILENTILMLIPSANPDGIDIVANWYRKTLGTPSEGTSPPELYHHYAGHDNNRDWFMLNLKETQAVTKLFWREWFPQIVYDVHQMGQNGARFIIPPFFDPPNPNIPPLILREVGLIGYKIAADLQAAKFAGVATNTTFDTWWHGGFRSAPYFHNSIGILSEAASANLMSPVLITEDKMKQSRPSRGLNSPLETSTSYPQTWQPKYWGAGDIAALEMSASRSVLQMAAKFRKNYLRNFYELNRANSRPDANAKQPLAYVVFAGQGREETVARFIEILIAQGIEVYKMNRELKTSTSLTQTIDTEIPLGSFLIFTDQPQRNNVEALFGKQIYPNRVDEKGNVDVPYDVAGWTLPLQMGVETSPVAQIIENPNSARQLEQIKDINQVRRTLNLEPATEAFAKLPNPLKTNPRIGLYKGFTASMDEGWTRLIFDTFQVPFKSISDADFRSNNLNYDAIILPSDGENSMVSGLKEENYPKEFTGGITEQGVENLKKFVENGGRLICFGESCEMIIKRFNLPLKNVLSGLKRGDFYCPGSILSLDVDKTSPLAKGFGKQAAAYFINSSAFEITDQTKVRSAATYANKNALLSGWLLGEKYLNGKTALAETNYGKGKIVLFAFRPQHRGQTFGTFPFIFNALEK
ncbi:MAG: M14 family metallopeptidase [Pyrinomonadaceae bacterium]|nr:M14 family metallopeptidase [Pyrinomonadaceae bacterium]